MKHLITLLLFVAGGTFTPAVSAETAEYLNIKINNYYKKRTDGTIGRSLLLSYHGCRSIDNAKVEIISKKQKEQFFVTGLSFDSIPILLSSEIGVKQNDTILVNLVFPDNKLSEKVIVPAMRHWTIYIYPHSHVDIGYTNTQENVEFIHKRNLDVAMELADKTRNYPKDARFCWNPEVVWPVERYLNSEPEEKKQRLLNAIKKGDISIDAGYVSTNTSASNDEELLQLFYYGKKFEKLTGKPVQTLVQTDIPGMSWGIVPAASQMGIKYVLSLFNGSDRTGWTHELSFYPFWWTGPDGKSKVLFLQPGAYTPGAIAKGKYFWPQLAGQTDKNKLLPVIRTDNPRANFIDNYLAEMLPKLEKDSNYPYDIFPMTWCMADNTPIDADLPDAVKSWNEEYAYPHIKICTATEIMQTFEKRWGDKLPELKGDFTEYWTDGLGSSAEKTGEARVVKEHLVQAEILWSMLRGDQEEPKDLVQEAWRNMILSTEHTWAFMDPYKQPIQDNILKTKYEYFNKAKSLTENLYSLATQKIKNEKSDQLTVFNTESWTRTDLVTVSKEIAEKYNTVLDSDGNEIVSQILSSGELVFLAENIPALGFRNYQLKKKNVIMNHQKANPNNILNNGLVEVKIDTSTGDVSNLLYKGEEFVDSEALVALNSYRYLKGNDTSGRAYRPTHIRIKTGETGPLVNSLIIESDAKGCNKLIREILLIKGSPAVYFNNRLDKQNILEKEGIHFGFAFNVPQSTIRVNIPWGVFELEKEQLKAANRNWIAMQRWLNISNSVKNVTWCSLNSCTFENGDMTANIIGGAYESPSWIRNLKPSSIIYSWALNNHWHTNFRLSQEGEINFKYSVLPSLGEYDAIKSNRFALEQYRPLIAVQTQKKFKTWNTLNIKGSDKIVLSNYKTINNGRTTVLRFLSLSDSSESIDLIWNKKQPKSVSHINSTTSKFVKPQNSSSISIPAKSVSTLIVEW